MRLAIKVISFPFDLHHRGARRNGRVDLSLGQVLLDYSQCVLCTEQREQRNFGHLELDIPAIRWVGNEQVQTTRFR